MVDFVPSVLLATLRLWVARYTDYEYTVGIVTQND
jgi:hypothetical protein